LNEIFYTNPVVEEVASDILKLKFLTPDGLDLVLGAVKSINTWFPNNSDENYFTQDMHLEKDLPDLYEMLVEHLHDHVYPAVSGHWMIPRFEVKNLFSIRYTLDTQTKLHLHHDDSFISASVKLNDDYEGAELYFPTKAFNNSDIAPGDIIVWPSNITHPHCCKDLISGEKHSLTIWSTECSES